ncbi:MAG: LapA family protein [Steroidobacteraceae bacterium]
MLAITGLLTALFLLYVAYMQTTAILEARRYARELQAQRKVADEAEASRIAELRTVVEASVRSIDERITQSQNAAQSALEQVAIELRTAIEQTGTVLSSYIGEMEDRLEHQLASAKPSPAP